MALKKSDLYSSLWKSCDELRGGMDASQYKDYVPGTIPGLIRNAPCLIAKPGLPASISILG